MASPQAENGHLDIANELAEAFARLQLSGNQWRLLWVILRQSYGWNKKMDRISVTFFQKKTGLKRRHVSRELNELVQRKIVTKIGDSFIASYGLQKDYTKWKLSPKLGPVTKIGDELSPKLVTTKTTTQKKIYIAHHGTEKILLQDGLTEILSLLNEKRAEILCNKGAKPITSVGEISARLKAGASVVECCRVVLCKAEDPYFRDNPRYFHPSTLFRKSNFLRYLDEAEIIRVKRSRAGEAL